MGHKFDRSKQPEVRLVNYKNSSYCPETEALEFFAPCKQDKEVYFELTVYKLTFCGWWSVDLVIKGSLSSHNKLTYQRAGFLNQCQGNFWSY